MRLFAFVTTLASGLAGAVHAGNVEPVPLEPAPVFAAAPAPGTDWTGGYGGLQLSYVGIDADGGGVNANGSGALFGLRSGYDIDFGRAVVGGLLHYDRGSIGLDGSGIAAGTDPELEAVLRTGVRVGVDGGRALYYAQGGYARAYADDIDDADGYFLGLGVEQLVTERLSIGVESNFHRFDEDSIDTDANTVGVNLNFRF